MKTQRARAMAILPGTFSGGDIEPGTFHCGWNPKFVCACAETERPTPDDRDQPDHDANTALADENEDGSISEPDIVKAA